MLWPRTGPPRPVWVSRTGQARPSQSAVLRINNVQLKKHILLLVRRNIVFTPIVLIIIIISEMQVFIPVLVHEYQPIF